jgi:hypothetical protein
MEVDDENVDAISMSEGGVDSTADADEVPKASVPELTAIQFDDKVELFTSNDGRQRWKCLWCNKTFHWNPTKALSHLARISKSDIAVCTGKIDDVHALTYRLLYNTKNKKKESNKTVQKSLEESISTHNNTTASVLDAKRRKLAHVSHATENASSNTMSTITTLNTAISVEDGRSGQHTNKMGIKNYLQLKVHDGSNASIESKLTMAIADMVHSCGLPFSLTSHLKFRRVLNLARSVPASYRPPGRNQVATELLDINYDTYMERNREKLCEDIEIFGLTFYGDGATVRKMPLINILASGGHIHAAVIEIVDATLQMQAAGKKDARYLASLFRPHLDSFEKVYNNCVDYCSFDGAGSVQKAGQVLNARYPRIIVSHGAEHVVSLFFQDCFGLPIISTLYKIERKAYALFGSGAHHSPYAIFQKYCKILNNGRQIGLFRPAGNRMAGAAIALMRAHKLRQAFWNTLNSHEFSSLKVS